MRIGLNGGGDFDRIEDVIEHARDWARDGFASYWLSQIFGVDALTVIAIAGREVPGIEFGTAIGSDLSPASDCARIAGDDGAADDRRASGPRHRTLAQALPPGQLQGSMQEPRGAGPVP